MKMRLHLLRFVLLLPAVGLAAGCGAPPEDPEDEAAFLEEVEAFRQERLDELRQPDSWLSLAGLYWLGEGANTFGSDAASDFVFPEGKAPARLGTITLEDGAVRVHIAPGIEVTHDGQRVETMRLLSDAEDAGPTVLRHGSLSWYVIDREDRLGVRLKDHAHPALAAFDGLDAFPARRGWRLAAHFEPYDPPRMLPILNIAGMVTQQTAPGAVVFDLGGQRHRLDVTGEPGDSTFFVIFADETNGDETYDAGRYLWIDAPDDAGRLVIDFNKAYNPPCVFTPYATCPLPPPQNRLPVRVEAGEKMYEKAVH